MRRRLVVRALREFALVPLLVVVAFAILAVLSILADQSHTGWLDAARRATGTVIGKEAAAATLQAIASGLVTVTSITFSVLLLAVQQTAASLSAVVFDQWVRRRSNQVFLGFFVGLALYSYAVMALVTDSTPPTLGAAVATALTVVAMLFLLVLVYTTVDQMRPASVIRLIHERTLDARRRELPLVECTRRRPAEPGAVTCTHVASGSGYVNAIDLDTLADAVDGDGELELCVTLGTFVAYGDVIAHVRGDVRVDAAAIESAVVIEKSRDLDYDATTGVDELANIFWTNASTSRQSPEVARQALEALRDIAARWLLAKPQEASEPLPVVYHDNDVDRILEVMYSTIVVSHESHQHHTAARALDAYRVLHRHAAGTPVEERIERDLVTAEAMLDQMPPSPLLERSRNGASAPARRRASRGVPAG